jgi:ectoine hydroxylase-related dioxygenase (phytanoyl-CoA dioxygenase family)
LKKYKNAINLRDRALLTPEVVSETNYLIRTRGYSIVQGILHSEEIDALRDSMLDAIMSQKSVPGVERSQLDRYQIHDLLNQDLNFARLLEDPRLQQVIAPHLGEHWIIYAATSSSIPPGGQNYSSRLHVDSPRHLLGYDFNIGLIWALNDYTPESGGALKILPGSHHSAEPPEENLFERHCDQILCPAGSLIVFSARLFHRTGWNGTQEWNHSMTVNACRSFMKPRMDWVRLIRPQVVAHLNSQALRLIGFDTRVPTSLDEFFLPDNQRLYKPNQG